MKKSLALAAALALPMMAYSVPAFSAAHEKAGDAPAVSEEHKATMMKACESAEDKGKCMSDQMAEHAKGGMHKAADPATPATPAAPAAQ